MPIITIIRKLRELAKDDGCNSSISGQLDQLAYELTGYIRPDFKPMPGPGELSDCCDARITEGGLCSYCLEHCC